MLLDNIGLMNGIMKKMSWLDQNQQVIAQNVANADTPGYRAQTLKEADFSAMLQSANNAMQALSGGPSMVSVNLAATDGAHFGAAGAGNNVADERAQKTVYETSPADNGVVLEEQLYNANQNAMQYQLATNLYRRSAGMLRMAIQGAN